MTEIYEAKITETETIDGEVTTEESDLTDIHSRYLNLAKRLTRLEGEMLYLKAQLVTANIIPKEISVSNYVIQDKEDSSKELADSSDFKWVFFGGGHYLKRHDTERVIGYILFQPISYNGPRVGYKAVCHYLSCDFTSLGDAACFVLEEAIKELIAERKLLEDTKWMYSKQVTLKPE
jgi:hypothetical protein